MIVKCNKLASPLCCFCARNSYKNVLFCIWQNAVAGGRSIRGTTVQYRQLPQCKEVTYFMNLFQFI